MNLFNMIFNIKVEYHTNENPLKNSEKNNTKVNAFKKWLR